MSNIEVIKRAITDHFNKVGWKLNFYDMSCTMLRTWHPIFTMIREQNLLLFTNIGQFFSLFVNYLESTMSEFRSVSESVLIVMKLNLLCALTLSRMSQSFDIAGGRYVRITCHINDLDYASWCESTVWQAMVWHFVSPDTFSRLIKSTIFFIKCAYCYFFFFFDFRCLRKKMRYFS